MSVPPSGVPDLISALSSGTVPVAIAPVHTREQGAELELMLWRIRGTRTVALRGLEGGTATFDVGLRRPVAMASDLKALFGRDLVGCRREGDVFRVALVAPPATHAPSAAAPSTTPLTGRWAVGAEEPAAPPTPSVPDVGAPAGSPFPAAFATSADVARLADPATLVRTLDADPGSLVLLLDTEGRIRAVHGALRPPWGPRAETVVGAALNDVAPPHLHRGLADRVAAVLRGAAASQVYTTAGAGRAFEIELRPVELGGRVVGCRATVRDVTGAHHDRELLRDLTGVFEVAFREAPTGQALMSPDGTWLRTNPALHELLRRDSGALHGTALADLLSEADAERERRLRGEVARGGRTRYAVDLDPRAAGLTSAGVRAHVAAIATPDGRIRGYFVHFAPTDELPAALDPEVVDGPW
jgi:PAS domain-containing protein